MPHLRKANTMTKSKRGAERAVVKVVCEYCHGDARRVGAEKIYPHRPDLIGKWFWECAPCGAYVGCHPGTSTPLGRLANAELRRAKQSVHRVLDSLWKSGAMKRHAAYKALAEELDIAPQNCHVGMFDVPTCVAAVSACARLAAARGRK